MFITLMNTTNYSEKCNLDTWLKRTQTNPTCPERSRRICSELARPELACGELCRTVEGSNLFYPLPADLFKPPVFGVYV